MGLFPDEQSRISKAKKPADSNPVQLPAYTISEPQVNRWYALRTARQDYLLHFNKPAVKKEAKAKVAKEPEEKKDDVDYIKMMIDENPTCTSVTSVAKKQPAENDATNTEHKQ
ncbi:9608_t:CDS:2 [Acaulospora colombiana]|uniref:9608_t:CDS:1 n=1 Tax=Acaulospora colombiana TaxID=27376 RepID=A0ACA9NWE3_9GLOM|nr:9608_t:CDS:2 [Acaulospora colombiana]